MPSYAVIGLGFGDEGKGSIVDALCGQVGADLVVKFNGGPQAAHSVVLSDGRSHVFSQWGSGTLSGVPTYLSPQVVFDPLAAVLEAEHLVEIGVPNPFDLLHVDPYCPVVTPYHKAVNRLREKARGDGSHGTCGRGFGEVVSDLLDESPMIRARDLSKQGWHLICLLADVRKRQIAKVKEFLPDLPKNCEAEMALFSLSPDDLFKRRFAFGSLGIPPSRRLYDTAWKKTVVYEGAQGVLLDEEYGFNPHTTWSKTTFDNVHALRELNCFGDRLIRIGVTRTYHTRHGAGPFPSEWVEGFSVPAEAHNDDEGWQGAFRVGPLDLGLLRYALTVCGGVDYLAVTHLDAEVSFVCDDDEHEIPFPCTLQTVEGLEGRQPTQGHRPIPRKLSSPGELLGILGKMAPVGIESATPMEGKTFVW